MECEYGECAGDEHAGGEKKGEGGEASRVNPQSEANVCAETKVMSNRSRRRCGLKLTGYIYSVSGVY